LSTINEFYNWGENSLFFSTPVLELNENWEEMDVNLYAMKKYDNIPSLRFKRNLLNNLPDLKSYDPYHNISVNNKLSTFFKSMSIEETISDLEVALLDDHNNSKSGKSIVGSLILRFFKPEQIFKVITLLLKISQ